ncbi:MAG: DUF6121 family protein [Cryobacterium sp.]
MRDYQKYAAVVAVFAAVLYVSLVVAGFGVVSLITDREVIEDPASGPLLGPVMVGAAVIVAVLLMVRLGIRTRPEYQRVALWYAIGSGFAASAAYILVGAVPHLVSGGRPVTFIASVLISPFTVTVGVLATVVVLSYSLILATQQGQRRRPLWPWETRDDG